MPTSKAPTPPTGVFSGVGVGVGVLSTGVVVVEVDWLSAGDAVLSSRFPKMLF